LEGFLAKYGAAITAWCGALCTFAVYSVLYGENKFYRFFEHVFIGLAAGLGVYVTWSQVLHPKWWKPMVGHGVWVWAFAAVAGSMFYFVYSRKHMWISRIIFGLFMGLAAGGIFREFYEIYFPQLGASMKPIAGGKMSGLATVNVLVFYVVFLCSMAYFFFSFDHKSQTIQKVSKLGRWFLMIAFGAIFGATVMGRLTLFIGRFNFILNGWGPYVAGAWRGTISRPIMIAVVVLACLIVAAKITAGRRNSTPES